MKPRIALALALALLSSAPRSAGAGDEGSPETGALGWLALLDQGRFDDAWREGADLLRSGKSKADWTEGMRRQQEKLGTAESRQILSRDYHLQFEGAPDGTYFTMRYRTHFSIAGDQLELVTVTPGPGGYRVAAYGIRR